MRKIGLLITFWTALLFFPISSLALGLGEIEVDTFLNQPLKAKIDVISARPGEVDDLLVSLASRDAFRKAGLERPANLSKLRFKVEKSEDGQSATILISTKTPVKEPFLNFLVEADWAKGRLLREFTILLDPPHFAQQAAAPVSEAAATAPEAAAPASPAPVAEQRAVPPAPIAEIISPETDQAASAESQMTSRPIAMQADSQAVREQGFAADPAMSSSTASDTITVGKGDTLWGIASRFKDEEHSMGQVMLAMQAMNPDAFGDDNINNLKVGAVLRAPDRDSLDRLSKQEAYAQVLEQNGLWDDYVARKTGSTSAGSPLATDLEDSGGQQSESQLSLLAPGDGDSTSASLQGEATSDNAGQIRKQLALAEEELEASRLENEDLKSRISDLERQLGKFEELQKLVQIEDDSLAQLQDRMAEEPLLEQADGMKDDLSGEVDEQPTEVMVEAADAMMREEAESQPMMDDTMVDAGPQQPEEMKSTEAETIIDTIQPGQQPDSMESQPQQQKTEEAILPAPVIVTETPTEVGDGGILDMLPSFGSILADPVMLGGIGAILALLIGLLFVKRKKASTDEEPSTLLEDEVDDLVDEDATPIHIPSAEEPEEDSGQVAEEEMSDTAILDSVDVLEEAEPEEDEFSSTAIISAEDMPEQEAPESEDQDDVLNEVDVYLAYGLYDNAEDLLKESLQNTPDRADYRAKLLDTHFATKNKDSFVKEAEALKSLGGAADRYWDRVQIMGFELDPGNELFAGAEESGLSAADLEYAKPETADFDIGAEEDITDFSGTDIDLGIDSEDSSEAGSSTQEITDTQTFAPDSDAGEDIELPSLDDEEETVLREEEAAAIDELDLPDEIGDFDLDLGEELVPESEVDEGASEAGLDDDALNFDLPDDLDLSTGDEDDVGAAVDDSIIDEDSLIPLEPTVKSENDGVVPPMEEDGDVEIEATDNVEIVFDDAEEAADIEIEATDNIEIDFDDTGEAADIEIEATDNIEIDFDDTGEAADVEVDLGEVTDTSIIDLDGEISQTMVIAPDMETESQAEPEQEETSEDDAVEEEQGTQHIEAALDMDMSDLDSADLQTGNFEPMGDRTADDITEFKPADMTDEFANIEDIEEPLEELDNLAGLEKTGTFAPGDFTDDEPQEEASAPLDSDDIEDLMLPDDVDEVGTKLDLAKAFIDMGDAEGARSSLEEVLVEGTEEQQAEATELLDKIK